MARKVHRRVLHVHANIETMSKQELLDGPGNVENMAMGMVAVWDYVKAMHIIYRRDPGLADLGFQAEAVARLLVIKQLRDAADQLEALTGQDN